jgi:hypothetical protein
MKRTTTFLVGLVLIVLVAVGAWIYGTRFGAAAEPAEVSPEAAASAEAKLERMREKHEEVRLSGVELTSLFRYRYPQALPGVVGTPSVAFSGDTVRLTGQLAADQLPDVKELNAVRDLLPDTTPVVVTGQLAPLADRRASFQVAGVQVAGIPIPSRIYGSVLERLGRHDEPGLAANAIAFPLPLDVASVRVDEGHLVLTP